MTKLTEICLKQRSSFIKPYGWNHSQKNGRSMDKNPPTFFSIIKKEEEKEQKSKSSKRESILSCKDQIDQILNCLNQNGKDSLSLCTQELNELKNCYHKTYSNDQLAIKMYNSQLDFILKTI